MDYVLETLYKLQDLKFIVRIIPQRSWNPLRGGFPFLIHLSCEYLKMWQLFIDG